MKEESVVAPATPPRGPADKPSDVLRALADRCEREEPSRELGAAIARACGWLGHPVPDNFCTSLDAAVTLVPPGHVWRAGAGRDGYADVAVRGIGFDLDAGHTWAKTAALALCAAALRARAAVLEQET